MSVRPPEPSFSHDSSTCQAVRGILNLVGDKWSILIVVTLEGGTKRFSEIQHGIEGISQRMLTRTLRELERVGLIDRRVEPTVPPSVYYSLTLQGRTLLDPVKVLAKWALDNTAYIETSKSKFDKKSAARTAAS